MAREPRNKEGLTQLHINDFPADIIEKIDAWAAAQRPDLTRRQVVIMALDEWVQRNVPDRGKLKGESEKERKRRLLEEEFRRKMAELES